jgi:hypothetical protein
LATAEGYEGRTESLRFDGNVDVTLSLEALAVAPEPQAEPEPEHEPEPTLAEAPAVRRTVRRRPAARMTPARMQAPQGRMTAGFTTANPY